MPNANHLSRDRSQQIHRNRGIIFVSVEAEHSQFPSITVFYGKVADTNWFYPWDRGSLARRRGTFAASFLAKIEGLRAGFWDGLEHAKKPTATVVRIGSGEGG
jgi:hypothetical protein